jgi:surface protein
MVEKKFILFFQKQFVDIFFEMITRNTRKRYLHQDDDESCLICLEDFTNEIEFLWTTVCCGKKMCDTCFCNLMRSISPCPFCRSPEVVPGEYIHPKALFHQLRFSKFNTDSLSEAVMHFRYHREQCEYQYGPIGQWDVSNVTCMDNLFESFHPGVVNIRRWNVRKVKSMKCMFFQCKGSFDLSNWNTKSCEFMDNMFAASEMQTDIGDWDVSNVLDMGGMFAMSTFNGDISKWNVSNVVNMTCMFQEAKHFDCDLSDWDVSNVTSMVEMFCEATAFNSGLFTNTDKVVYMSSMFKKAYSFNQPVLFLTANVICMEKMFLDAFKFNSDISNLDTQKVQDFSCMFGSAVNFNQNISKWNLENCTSMTFMFYGALSFNQDISAWKFPKCTSLIKMFRGTAMVKDNKPMPVLTKIVKKWKMIPQAKDGLLY